MNILIVAVPVRSCRTQALQRFDATTSLQRNVHRLLGRSLKVFGVTKGLYEARSRFKGFDVDVRLVKLVAGQNVAIICLGSPASTQMSGLEKAAKRDYIETVLKTFNIDIDSSSSVDGIVGLVSTSKAILDQAPSHWIATQADQRHVRFVQEIYLEIIARVAIERELLVWATKSAKFPLSLFKASLAGYRIRRWPVQLLSDRIQHSDNILITRERFNLPNVRQEILDRARSWWTVVAATLAIVSLIVSFVR